MRPLILLVGILQISLFSFAQKDSSFQNPLTIQSVRLEPVSPQDDKQFSAKIQVTLDERFHAYSDKLSVKLISPAGQVGEVFATPVVKFVDYAGKKHQGLRKKALLEFLVEASQASETYDFSLHYIACTKKICLPPKSLKFQGTPVKLILDSKTPPTPSSSWSVSSALEENLLWAFLLIFFFGFLTSLTPCVYPLIPITLAVIGSQSQNVSRWRSFALSWVYVIGIATTYSLLGVVAAKTGALFGQALSYPPVIIGFAVLFFAMAMSSFGFFEIRAPLWLSNKVSSQKSTAGFAGAFFSGLVAGVVASPCVGPVLVSVLAYIAKAQDAVLGFFLLFTFALGMGLLFVVLGTFSSLAQKIPRSGSWMDVTKFILGTALLGLSLYYLNPLLSSSQFWAATALLGALLTGVVLRIFPPSQKAVLFSLVIALGATTSALVAYKKMAQGEEKTSTNKYINGWKPYSEDALAQAKQEGRPVIIDFYADWCFACVELDHKTFVVKEVVEKSKKFVLLKVDATEVFEGLTELQERFDVYGLPTIVFLDGQGKMIKDLSLTGFEEAPKFLKRMDQALKN